VPAIVTSMTGRRPIRSESRPQAGEKMNCIAAWLATRRPRIKPFAPKRSDQKGRIGTTIPNPIRSTTMTLKRTVSLGGPDRSSFSLKDRHPPWREGHSGRLAAH